MKKDFYYMPTKQELRYDELRRSSSRKGESGDCGVMSVAAATDETYDDCHMLLNMLGRPNNKGTHWNMLNKALAFYDKKVTNLNNDMVLNDIDIDTKMVARWYCDPILNPKTNRKYTPISITKSGEFSKGTYLVFTKSHVSCIKDGIFIDWMKGNSRYHVLMIWKVE